MKNRLKVKIKDFGYDNSTGKILQAVDFSLSDGDILWIHGCVGCGKTTLLKLIAGIIPNFEDGRLRGEILLNGIPIGERTYTEITFCFQHSDNQLLFDSIRKQFFGDINEVKEYIEKMGIDKLGERAVMDLSRGERKYVALASTLFKKRKLYILDEPLDLLDDNKKKIIMNKITEVSRNAILVICSHDTNISLIANKELTYDEDGKFKFDGTEKTTFDNIPSYILPKKESVENFFLLDEQEYKYEGNSECISIPSLSIGENEIVGIVGRNGCGKTTILKSIAGTILSKSETPRKSYSVFGFLSQNVNRQLFANSVKEELYLGIKNISKEKEKYGEFLLYEFGLKGLENTHPVFLSGGQKQKLILASLLMHNPEIVLLDELFTNLDVVSIKKIFFVLSEYRKNNNLSIILTDQQSQILKEICDKMIYL